MNRLRLIGREARDTEGCTFTRRDLGTTVSATFVSFWLPLNVKSSGAPTGDKMMLMLVVDQVILAEWTSSRLRVQPCKPLTVSQRGLVKHLTEL